MSRAFQNTWDHLLKEMRIDTEDTLVRLLSLKNDVAVDFDQRYPLLKSRYRADLLPYTPDCIDISDVLNKAFGDYIDLLKQKLQDINDEFEEREIERQDSRDPTGGIAA